MKLSLHHIDDLTENIRMFWFVPQRPLQYTAGQYVELTLKHDNPDEHGIKHWYTLSSSPTEELLAITTKAGVSTFKYNLWLMKPGQTLYASEAMGDFVLPKDKTIPLVFAVGGIGITPVRSIIKWLSDTNEKRHIRIMYAAHSRSDMVFLPLIKDYEADLNLIVGKLSASEIIKKIGPHQNHLIYLSGPEPMVDSLRDNLIELGINQSQLVSDGFSGYSKEL